MLLLLLLSLLLLFKSTHTCDDTNQTENKAKNSNDLHREFCLLTDSSVFFSTSLRGETNAVYTSSVINLIKLYLHIIWIIHRITCLLGNTFLPMKAPWVLRLFSTHCFYDVSDGVMARGVLLRVTIKIWPFDDFHLIFFLFRLKKEF